MISANSLMKKLNTYAATPKGKKAIKDVVDGSKKSGKRLASGDKIISEADMDAAADRLIEIIKSLLPDSIKTVGDSLGRSLPEEQATGETEVKIYFNEAELRRESLRSDLFPDGIDNIVALLNNGYNARNYVYGEWKGHNVWVRSRKDREPLLFMQKAVDEFNARYGERYNVTAILDSAYGGENK